MMSDLVSAFLWGRSGAAVSARGSSPRRARRRWRARGPEGLEGRALLTTAGTDYVLSGFHWANPAHITYSIAPDGVEWDHGVNDLTAALDARLGAGAWERQVARALATWEAVANINISEAPDGAYDFNSPGRPQGDPRFGDIRVGGYSFADDSTTLAQTYYPPPDGATAAGDVALNTGMTYHTGSDYDLYSVLLHETGHALGLDHARAFESVMYAAYQGVRAGLTPGDVAGIQAVYGPRSPDALQRQGRGLGFGSAVDVSAGLDAAGQETLTRLSLATIGGTEYFTVVAPAGATGGLSVTASAGGISLLSPKVTLLDASHNPIDAASNPAAWGDDVTAYAAGVRPGRRYYVAVTGATGDVFSVGAYALKVAFTVSPAAASPPRPVTVTAPAPVASPVLPASPPANTPAGSHTTMARATPLGPVTRAAVPGFSYDAAGDPEFFVFQTTHTGDYWVGATGSDVRVLDPAGRTLAAGPGLVALPVYGSPTTLFVEVTRQAGSPRANHSLAIASFAFGTGPAYPGSPTSFARLQAPPTPPTVVPDFLADPSLSAGHDWARARGAAGRARP